MMVCCLTRLRECSLLLDLTAKTAPTAFMSDWVRFVGESRRTIMDAGSPGLLVPEWDRLSHVYCWQMIEGPPRAPNQNGILARSPRCLKNSCSRQYGQAVLTMGSIARNHVPRSASGIPNALGMTGRADLLAGAEPALFDHAPTSGDTAIKKPNGMSNILNARNAATAASARQEL